MELTTEFKLAYEVSDEQNEGIPAIIVAAGESRRMGGVDKQSALLAGVPVLARTLLNFERSSAVSAIILVVKEKNIFTAQLLAEQYGISKLTDIVCGGASRQQSVLNGFSRLDKSAERVLIHDGARPLTEDFIIRSVAEKLKTCSAVTCAVSVKDTIKTVDENGVVTGTPDRTSLVAVQTPQGVRVADYRAAAEQAGDVSGFTDDMSVMEAAGCTVYTVLGSYRNIKITTPEDIVAAEGMLRGETEE